MWRSYFYPRTPCGVRHVFAPGRDLIAVFLSTYPVRGTTLCRARSVPHEIVFLSTYPVRGTTDDGVPAALDRLISIHVPRAGYDTCVPAC